MFYDFAITVPANTLATTPKVTRLKLTQGFVTQVEVGFPPGCNGMVRARITRGLNQVWPSNTEGYFGWDSFTVSYPEFYPLDTPPYELVCETWSPGTTYPHTITVRVGVTRGETILTQNPLGRALDRLLKALRIGG